MGPTVWQALMRAPWRLLLGQWPWRALAYLLLSAVIGLVLVPIVIVSLLLVPLWGIAIGALERRRTRILGFPAQASGHVRLGREQRHIWLSVRMAEVSTWRETSALLVDLVMGGVALVVLGVEGLCLAVFAHIGTVGSRERVDINLWGDLSVIVGPDSWWPVIPLGLLALCLFAYLDIMLAGVQASLLRVLCGPRQHELARNVERLTQSRATLVEAFETERRRIERDLHDGVQQELVTLAARLGMVSLELDEVGARGAEISVAKGALDEAHSQAEHAMKVLRDTVRGIHPAVLADHGLRAALHELADRTPVPISLDVADLGRLPTAAETAAYYLVTEAISNAAKHAAATLVTVRAVVEDATLTVIVSDDGHGGADESIGSGLRGLRERADTLGGTFAISSPPGGPSRLRMTIPINTEGAAHDATAAR